ncbi:MAG: polyamine aminopropyltransferase, partial [Oscillospiraceae bacterium]|nr:polyamine aminopropyltransferase [Oscillospiraceae bacterium]
VYELIISAVSSYLIGDSTLQYSVTIGLYMFSLGIGSFLSKFIRKDLWNWFANVEIGIGIVGGLSALTLFLANLYLESYALVMYAEILVIGTFAGLEIPLLTRIIEEERKELRVTLSSIFSFDYIGGLIGAIAFPMLLLPHLGYFATAFLVGSFNLLAAVLIIYRYGKRLKHRTFYRFLSAGLLGCMFIGMFFAQNVGNLIEGGLYRDDVILIEQTSYQKIVVTRHKDDMRLYIDGNCQFSSVDEYRYHECLVHVPMAFAEKQAEILVLGGGDGLAVRELLKYPDVSHITLIDLDSGMTKLCSENPQILKLNGGSLLDERITIRNMDAYEFLEHSDALFDVILVDLPDPNNEALAKLYTNVFYRMCASHLTDQGILNVQSTSPYYAAKAFWCINRTMESEGLQVKPFHLQVPAFGDWGFNMASKTALQQQHPAPSDTRYLTEDTMPGLFLFGKDETVADVEINRLTKPILIQYYNEAARNWQ